MALHWPWYKEAPSLTAEFTATPISGPAPLTVFFTNNSIGQVDKSQWDFGDGWGVSPYDDVRAPMMHFYYDPGVYHPRLTVIGPAGKSSKSATITVIKAGL